jgi:arabinogalactan endo-1,4-beta-galactosidase
MAALLVLALLPAQDSSVRCPHVSPSGALSIRGADISFTLQEEAAGNFVHGPHGPAPMEHVLASYGANTVRLRLWVDPAAGTSDLPATLELARRAAAAGLAIVLVLHYSDTWADHRTQPTPAAWASRGLDELTRTVRQYTSHVVAAFASQGTPVAIIQVGNEIDNGLLWPAGRLAAAGWDAVAGLVGAGAAGARAGGGTHPPEVMVHLAASGDIGAVSQFIRELAVRGVHPDLLGLSYYPWWNGSLAHLQHALNTVAEQFDLDVLLAETAYPWTLADGDGQPNAVTRDVDLPDGAAYPATPAGQAAWAEALRRLLCQVPAGHGVGFLFWEPGWLPGVQAEPGAGSVYDNTTLFRWDGSPLPALGALRPSIVSPTPGDRSPTRRRRTRADGEPLHRLLPGSDRSSPHGSTRALDRRDGENRRDEDIR